MIVHLEERLEEHALKFAIDLGTYFNLKVGERIVEVCAVADADYTILVGQLGGRCVPEKTTWEIAKIGDTLALKLSFQMAPGSYNQWSDENFKRMQPWEVVESMHREGMEGLEDEQAQARQETEE